MENLGWNENNNEKIYGICYSLLGERNAKEGEIRLYDPDFVVIRNWNIANLNCLAHNEANDGLVSGSLGSTHILLVSVPVSLMRRSGVYRFVLCFEDNNSDYYKNHQDKSVLEMGVELDWRIQMPDETLTGIADAYNTLVTVQNMIDIPIDDTCPPTGKKIPKIADVNGDGVTDWDYPGDVKIPGTNLVVGIFGIDKGEIGPSPSDEYRLGIGVDRNNNGKLDPDEKQYWIGKCPWIGGLNNGEIERIDNNWYVHWISEEPPIDRK